MRDLGLLGEAIFQKWAAERGLIVNGSRIDRTGWDFIVEFPYSNLHAPAESAPAPIECKIQVKATDTNSKKLRITLSNLLRLAKSPIPTFILLISFDGKNEPQEAMITHLGVELVSRIMKRVREIDQSPQQNRINKRSMTIVLTENERLQPLNGIALANMISSHLPRGLGEYVKDKQETLTRIGYQGVSMQASFSTCKEVGLDRLLDASLGLAENVEISNLVGHDCRFGIRERNPSLNWESATLKFPEVKPVFHGRIVFREKELGPSVTVDCSIYNSPLNEHLPDQHKKLRVSGRFFELWIKPLTGVANFTWSLSDGNVSIQEMRSATRVLGMLATPANKVYIQILGDDFPGLGLSIIPNSIDPSWKVLARLGESTYYLASLFDIEINSQVELEQLLQDSERLNELHDILNSQAGSVRIEFSLTEAISDYHSEYCCQFFVWCKIGNHYAGGILSLVGSILDLGNNRFCLSPNKIDVVEKVQTTAEGGFDKSIVGCVFSRSATHFENAGICVIQMRG